MARRDVRWLDPIAPGEPHCALVVYTMTCSSEKVPINKRLEYDRKQKLLDEPAWLPSEHCGEKSTSKLQPVVARPARIGPTLSPDARCDPSLDRNSDKFELRDVIYMNVRAIVSRSFLLQGDLSPSAGIWIIKNAVRKDGEIHLVDVAQPLPDNGENLFVQKTFSEDGRGYCVTLAAWQGDAQWRRTIYADELPSSTQSPGDRAGDRAKLRQMDIILQTDLLKLLGINRASD